MSLAQYDDIVAAVRSQRNPEKAAHSQRFFKTGAGEYAEGDRFLGLTVPRIRVIARTFRHATFEDACKLLESEFHEERLLALFLFVDQFKRAPAPQRKRVYDFYLSNSSRVNNWDLVDSSAEYIVGGFLDGVSHNDALAVLKKLARSKLVWDRRIAMLATFHFIKKGDASFALDVAGLLVHDSHDLIHKAVGWMLREVGNRCSLADEEAFLRVHARTMPRTMLRYAIEKFPPARRSAYLLMK